eukprot:g2093.t1
MRSPLSKTCSRLSDCFQLIPDIVDVPVCSAFLCLPQGSVPFFVKGPQKPPKGSIPRDDPACEFAIILFHTNGNMSTA